MSHVPVLLEETLEGLALQPAGVYLDATVGAGGHAQAIAERLVGGRLIGLDRDPQTLEATRRRLAPLEDKVCLRVANFVYLKRELQAEGVAALEGALFDLGVSSMQLGQAGRGFSFLTDGPLDMRMGPDAAQTAADLLNSITACELAKLIRDYGEERFAQRIAAAIVSYREHHGCLSHTVELARIIEAALPAPARRKASVHPATRTFQAIRIAVNDELNAILPALEDAFELLKPGGRLVVIAFHSLEDRLVKRFFKAKAQGCTCPPKLPQCVCGKTPQAKCFPLIRPSKDEVAHNPRARSARLRVAQKRVACQDTK